MTATAAPFVRALHLGDVGPDVTAVKRALVKWNHGNPAGVVVNNTVGGAVEKLEEKFQRAQGLTADGIYGPKTHARLSTLGLFDDYGIELLAEERKALAAAAEPRHLFLSIADLTVVHASLYTYTEAIGENPGERDWFRVAPIDTTGTNWTEVVAQHGKLTCDCSGHYIGCGEHAGVKSNVASGVLDSDGATAALLDDLQRITLAAAQPGDGVIWIGPGNPGGVHISILRARLANGDWRVVNMGGAGDPSYSTLSAQQAWHAEHMNAPTQVVVRFPA